MTSTSAQVEILSSEDLAVLWGESGEYPAYPRERYEETETQLTYWEWVHECLVCEANS